MYSSRVLSDSRRSPSSAERWSGGGSDGGVGFHGGSPIDGGTGGAGAGGTFCCFSCGIDCSVCLSPLPFWFFPPRWFLPFPPFRPRSSECRLLSSTPRTRFPLQLLLRLRSYQLRFRCSDSRLWRSGSRLWRSGSRVSFGVQLLVSYSTGAFCCALPLSSATFCLVVIFFSTSRTRHRCPVPAARLPAASHPPAGNRCASAPRPLAPSSPARPACTPCSRGAPPSTGSAAT